MQYLLLVYIDQDLIQGLPKEDFDRTLDACFRHADLLQKSGTLVEAQRLEPASAARTVRVREGRRTVIDGPFAETKEVLAGFNLIEARDMDEALRLADGFAWSRYGSIEVRPVLDRVTDRQQAAQAAAAAG